VFDIGITKLAIIGGIALVVIGPERLPGLARTVGTLLGRARRYVADVKEEVNRSMELDAIRKMRDTVEEAARDVETAVQTHASAFSDGIQSIGDTESSQSSDLVYPIYQHPKKKWRLKQGAVPHWYKARQGVRTRALSGAARVARHRPAPH
jgi:sec-independent protein translocase protein TatB